jgi:hypothetical protein
MSFTDFADAVQTIVGELTPALFLGRNIGGLVADITIEEDGTDELEITSFPVEQGADITDHSFVRPSRVKIQVGYSNSSPVSGGDPNYIVNSYNALLSLQQGRQPFTVVTGKRTYDNMLIERLHQHTDQKLENALIIDVECRTIILTTTQTVSVPPSANMQNPAVNGATSNGGSQTLQPGTNFNTSQATADGTLPQ